MATTAVNIACQGCTCNISYYNNNGVLQTGYCSNNSSVTVYANNSYSVTLSQISTASGYTTPITFYYNRSNGSGYDGSETLSGSTRTISDLSFGRTLKLVATGATVTAHLKCGNGISSYRVYDSSGSSIAQITGTNSYTTLTLTKGASYTLGGIAYEDGWSGIIWYYNTSGNNYPNTFTTDPDYKLNSNYDRWGYFEATTYTPPSYTYYYRVNLYIDGNLSRYTDRSATTTASTGYNIALSTCQDYFTIDDKYEFSTAVAGANCTYSRGYFTVTSTSSSNRSICNIYYLTKSYLCKAVKGIGIAAATVNGYSSSQVDYGSQAQYRCTLEDGYTWVGWYEDDMLLSTTRNLDLTIQTARTLEAVARPSTTYQYTIRVYRNQTSTDSTYRTYYTDSGTSISQAITMPSCPWSQTGKSFSYWSANRSGTDGVYYAGRTYYFSSDQTLYAIWKTDSYWQGADVVSGSSSGVDSVYVNDIEGGTYVDYGGTAVWKCIPNPGYKFDGWYDSSGTKISSLNPYTRSNVTSALTLYADVNEAPYSAQAFSTGFGCCFSSVRVDKPSFSYGDTVTFTADLNPGYTFRGWYNSSGTRVSTNRSYSVTGTDNITLYARANFAWTYDKSSGSSIISAEEFRRLQTYITQRNGASFSSQPNVGDAMTRDYYNMLKNAIGAGSTVIRFQAISAALLNALRDNANNL